MNKILCIGEALIDMICTDSGVSLTEGLNFLKKAGGAPTNVAAAIAALGGKVELLAKVGDDPFGEHLIEVMKEFGIGTKGMFKEKGQFTTLAFVSLLKNGERDFYFNRGADALLNWQEVDNLPLDDFSMIHFGSATAFLPGPLQEAYALLLKKARAKKIFTCFDPNYRKLLFQNDIAGFRKHSWEFLENCDFFKVSDEEALLLTEQKDLDIAVKLLLKNTKAVFAITLGKEGTLLGINGETIIIPSIAVKAIDTTGAGDAFVGAVLFQLSNYPTSAIKSIDKAKWREIIYNGNKAGARTCEYLGAMEAFRHLSGEILK